MNTLQFAPNAIILDRITKTAMMTSAVWIAVSLIATFMNMVDGYGFTATTIDYLFMLTTCGILAIGALIFVGWIFLDHNKG